MMNPESVRHIPTDPFSVANKLTWAKAASRVGHAVDEVELYNGVVLFIVNDSVRIVSADDSVAKEIRFKDLPDFPMQGDVGDTSEGDDRFSHIRAYGSDQTGGMVMVDWLEHRAGVLFTISDECVLVWRASYRQYWAVDDPSGYERGIAFDNMGKIGY